MEHIFKTKMPYKNYNNSKWNMSFSSFVGVHSHWNQYMITRYFFLTRYYIWLYSEKVSYSFVLRDLKYEIFSVVFGVKLVSLAFLK
jgi:hypothetical protein